MQLRNLLCVLTICSSALAQSAQPAVPAAAGEAPNTRPADAAPPPERRALSIPPGFKIIMVNRRSVVCQEGDEAWVRQALDEAKPATVPSTMPADLLELISDRRDVIAERVAADLGLADRLPIKDMIDQDLIPLLRRASSFDPPVFYMVSSEPTVRQLLKDGWENPLFYLNRAADHVSMNNKVSLSLSESMNDTLLPAMYQANDDFATRRRLLLDSIAQAEARMAYELSIQSEYATQMAFVGMVGKLTLQPLGLKPDQDWFSVGLVGVLSSKYLAVANGMNEDSFLRNMTKDDRRNPVRAATVDLLHPTAAADMRPEFRPPYLDAYRRKATAVMQAWLTRLPSGGLAKTLAAIKANPPADGPALVKLINSQTGIDLTKELLPQ